MSEKKIKNIINEIIKNLCLDLEAVYKVNHKKLFKIWMKKNNVKKETFKYDECKNFTLENDGVEVVENVLSAEEIQFLQSKMWELLNFKTKYTSKPVVENDPSTYGSLFELAPTNGQLFQHWDFGHNFLSWRIRQNKKIIDKFASIWGTNDLLTSFDGISVSLPCEVTNRGWYTGKEFFHLDQSLKRNKFECVQGLVNLFDVFEGDGTLRVLKGSHKLHEEFQKQFKINSSNWYQLKEEDQKQFYIDRLGEDSDICVKAPAGSLVLWDSRTVHQGMKPQRNRKTIKTERLPYGNIRCVPYVCMTPARLASQSQLRKRIKYFKERKTCNHCPHKLKKFGIKPYIPGVVFPRVDNDLFLEETELIKNLVGYKYYRGAL
jgi:hypothetical protein